MIRQFHNDDTDAVASIWREASSLAHPFLTEDFMEQEEVNLRNIYLPNAETWVLEFDDELVGFIALIEDEIGGLFLNPSLHRQGLGKAMVDHVVDLKGRLRVDVFQKNDIGRGFYKSYGFVEVERYQHETSGEMTLKLVMP